MKNSMKTKTILLMLLSIISINLLRAETITVDMIVYSLDENNHTAQVVDAKRGLGLRGEESAITEANIRSSITYRGASYRVISVRRAAFEDCRRLTTASIPSSVQIIEEGAFRRCYALTSVTISAKEIANDAFEGCTNLQYITLNEGIVKIGDGALKGKNTSITIPNSVTKIGIGAFASSTLQTVKFGSGIKRIERSAFASTALLEVVIPQNVTSIGGSAFSGCKKLTKITIHNKVKEIEDAAFSNCTSLQTFDLANDNPYFTVVDGVLFNKDKTILIQYPSGKKNTSYTIPSSVKKIAAYAFENIPSLHSIQISNSVTEIGDGNFNECRNLEKIQIGNHVQKIGSYVCQRCFSLTDFTVPNSVEEIGGHAFEYCNELIEIVIPGSVQYIGSHAFANCRSLTIKVPSHTRCHNDAFIRSEKWEFYDTTNPVAERKKAQEEENRKKVQAEKDRQWKMQFEKEWKEREQKAQKEEEARRNREAKAKKDEQERAAYAKREKAYQDSIKAGSVRGLGCVDLGLSVVWATCNLGAKNPQKDGSGYSENDVAQAIRSRNGWRLPTTAECWELINNCTIEPVGGFLHTKCIKLTSKKNGNSIIIPNTAGVVSSGICTHLWVSAEGNGKMPQMIWRQTELSSSRVGADNYRHELEMESARFNSDAVRYGFIRCVIDKSPKK